jgi:hypothetical protein
MKVGIVFRVGNERLTTYGRYTMMKDSWYAPLLMYPDTALRMKAWLVQNGIKTVKFIPECRAFRIHRKHSLRVYAKYQGVTHS